MRHDILVLVRAGFPGRGGEFRQFVERREISTARGNAQFLDGVSVGGRGRHDVGRRRLENGSVQAISRLKHEFAKLADFVAQTKEFGAFFVSDWALIDDLLKSDNLRFALGKLSGLLAKGNILFADAVQ